FDDGDAVGHHRHTLFSVDFRGGNGQFVGEKGEAFCPLKDRKDKGAAAPDDLHLFSRGVSGGIFSAQHTSGYNHGFIGTGGFIPSPKANGQHDEDDGGQGHGGQGGHSWFTPLSE